MKELIEEYGAMFIVTILGTALIACAAQVFNYISASL